MLYNDAELRKEKQLPKTQIETDSYVAVQLIEREGKLNFESLRSMAEEVRGSFTFTILDERNNLYFVKGSSPLYLIYFPDFGLYVYASTAGIMHKALKGVSLNHLNYEVIAVEDGEILRITPSAVSSVIRSRLHRLTASADIPGASSGGRMNIPKARMIMQFCWRCAGISVSHRRRCSG